MAQPPLCSLTELSTVLSIDELADLHEALNVREAAAKAQQQANKRQRGRR